MDGQPSMESIIAAVEIDRKAVLNQFLFQGVDRSNQDSFPNTWQ
jgi:hypothetical protein